MDVQLSELGTMEYKTLILLHQGDTNLEIATKLNRTTKTIEAYTSNIYADLGVKNRVQAALYYEKANKET